MTLMMRVPVLLLACGGLSGTCLAKEAEADLGEHFLKTLGVRQMAGMIIANSDRLAAAVRGVLQVKSVQIQPTSDGRGVERRELEITLAGGADEPAAGRKIMTLFSSPEQELGGSMAHSLTLFDQLLRRRWHDSAGEVVILQKNIPKAIGDEFSSEVIKLPAGSLQWLEGALSQRRQHQEWFVAANINVQTVKAMAAEFKQANPLWALVLRMWLYSQGHAEFTHEWGAEVGAHTTYDAALVMHMVSQQENLPAVFDPLVTKSLHSAGAGSSLALGALCASVESQHGLLCWYQCGLVHHKGEATWEDWQELAPSIKLCPSYRLACRLSLAQRHHQHTPEDELMLHILQEMCLLKRE